MPKKFQKMANILGKLTGSRPISAGSQLIYHNFKIVFYMSLKSITAMYRFRQSSIYHALRGSALAQDRWKKMEKVPLYFEGLQLVPDDQK